MRRSAQRSHERVRARYAAGCAVRGRVLNVPVQPHAGQATRAVAPASAVAPAPAVTRAPAPAGTRAALSRQAADRRKSLARSGARR